MANPVTPRHVRHRQRSRLRHSTHFTDFLSGLQALLTATGATVTPWTATADSASLTMTAHGLAVGDGPYLASNSGGALPTNLDTSTLYWVATVPDANTFTLTTQPGGDAIVLSA